MNPIELPAAGLHYGVPYEDYAAWPAINFSKLKPIKGTCSKCKWEMDHPKKPTPAMILGSAMHVAVLEPARFEELFNICPPCDCRTKEGKEVFEKAKSLANGRILIRDGDETHGDVQRLRGMSVAIRSLKSAAPFLNGAGHNEVCALWKDEETGLWCKARLDRLIPAFDKLGGIPVVVEVKTAADGDAWKFSKEIDNRYYSAQAASYSLGIEKITGKKPMHVFIVAESSAPFDAAVYTLDDQSLQTGLNQYRQMLNRYAECVKTDHWPGYPDKIQVLKLPDYSHNRNYEK